MRCCHGKDLNPKIDYQKKKLIITEPILINPYSEYFKRDLLTKVFFSNSCSIGKVFINTLGSIPLLCQNIELQIFLVYKATDTEHKCAIPENTYSSHRRDWNVLGGGEFS